MLDYKYPNIGQSRSVTGCHQLRNSPPFDIFCLSTRIGRCQLGQHHPNNLIQVLSGGKTTLNDEVLPCFAYGRTESLIFDIKLEEFLDQVALIKVGLHSI